MHLHRRLQIVHIDIDTASISRNIQVDIPIVADAKEAIDKMIGICRTNVRQKKAGWNRSKAWKEEHPLRMKPKGDQMQDSGYSRRRSMK